MNLSSMCESNTIILKKQGEYIFFYYCIKVFATHICYSGNKIIGNRILTCYIILPPSVWYQNLRQKDAPNLTTTLSMSETRSRHCSSSRAWVGI